MELFSSAYIAASYDTWRARLGHAGFSSIKNMMKIGLMPKHESQLKSCEVCEQSKYAEKPFKNVERSSKFLGLIHNDICYLNNTFPRGIKRYFITFMMLFLDKPMSIH